MGFDLSVSCLEVRRVEDRNGEVFYIVSEEIGGDSVSDIHGLRETMNTLVGGEIEQEIASTISDMVIEGYLVRYFPKERRVTGEVVFKRKSPDEGDE